MRYFCRPTFRPGTLQGGVPQGLPPVRFLALAAMLSPAMLQQTSCEPTAPTLSSLSFEIGGVDQIDCFAASDHVYHVILSDGEVTLTVASDPADATVFYGWVVDNEAVGGGTVGVGGGTVAVEVPVGTDRLTVNVIGSEGGLGQYNVHFHNAALSSWSEPQLIAEWPAVAGGEGPLVGVASNGDAVAAWTQWDGNTYSAYAARFVSGSWQAPQLLENDSGAATGDTFPPCGHDLAVNADGDAVVVWTQRSGEAIASVYANRLVSGVWSGRELVEDIDTGNAECPRADIAPDGDAIAVWALDDGTGDHVYATRFTSGAWQESVQMDVPWSIRPDVSVSANGDAVVAWKQNSPSVSYQVWANRLVSGVWGTPVRFTDGLGNSASPFVPAVVVDPAGDALVGWEDSGVYFARLVDGAWQGAQQHPGDDLTTFSNQRDPIAAVAPNGEVILAWNARVAGRRTDTFASRLTSTGWGPLHALRSDGSVGEALRWSLALDDNATAVAVVIQTECPSPLPRKSYLRRTVPTGWSSAELLPPSLHGAVVGARGDGHFVLVSRPREGSHYRIYGSSVTVDP